MAEVLEDETMKDLSIDFLIDQVHAWKNVWQQAAAHSGSLPLEVRQLIMRKTSDPNDAIQDLVPVISAMHPEVIDFILAILEEAATQLNRLRDGLSDAPAVEDEEEPDPLSLEERIERLETIVQGMGAVTHPLRN